MINLLKFFRNHKHKQQHTMTTTHPITVKQQVITPEVARRMLDLNTNNRPLRKSHVEHLSREMKLGRWKVNGDTICLNGSRLIDGQHRLAACVESGCSFETLVVSGVDSDVFDTKDVGKKRTASDTLSVRGEINTALLAATLALVERYMTGRILSKLSFTNIEVEQALNKYPGVRESVYRSKNRTRLAPGSVVAACHYLFSQIDAEQADQFMGDIIGGHNLSPHDSVYMLRERLMNNAISKAKLKPEYIMALFIKTWNARRTGKMLRQLIYRTEGKTPEQFPIAQ
jgi:hypothetical protein